MYLNKYKTSDKIKKKESRCNMEKRTVGKSSTRAKNKYNQNNYDRFNVVIPLGKKEKLDKAIKELGYTSRNEFVLQAIKEKLVNSQKENVLE